MKQVLKSAIEIKSRLQPQDYLSPNEEVINMKQQLDDLLNTDLTNKPRKVQAFIKRLQKNNNAIFTFLYHLKVPLHNNAFERAIRNAKVKMKVSNQFKSFTGAYRFAVLRSVIDTTIKNSQNVFGALCQLAITAE